MFGLYDETLFLKRYNLSFDQRLRIVSLFQFVMSCSRREIILDIEMTKLQLLNEYDCCLRFKTIKNETISVVGNEIWQREYKWCDKLLRLVKTI